MFHVRWYFENYWFQPCFFYSKASWKWVKHKLLFQYLIHISSESCGDGLRFGEFFICESPFFRPRHLAPIKHRVFHDRASKMADINSIFFTIERGTGMHREELLKYKYIRQDTYITKCCCAFSAQNTNVNVSM